MSPMLSLFVYVTGSNYCFPEVIDFCSNNNTFQTPYGAVFGESIKRNKGIEADTLSQPRRRAECNAVIKM